MRPYRHPARPPIQTRRRLLRLPLVLALVASAVTGELAYSAAGSASTPHRPTGAIDSLAQDGKSFALRGWAYDPNTKSAIRVQVRVDNKLVKTVQANAHRPDVAAKHRGVGSSHGFTARWTARSGRHRICVSGVDYPSKAAYRFACRWVTGTHNPVGAINWLTVTPGHVRVTGWALDNDAVSAQPTVSVLVDGHSAAHGKANRTLASLATSHPAAGSRHGYSFTVPLRDGTHTICARVTNVGSGASTTVACASKTVNFSPTGKITKLAQAAGGFSVAGYASDPDTRATTTVTLTADGTPVATVAAKDSTGSKPGYGFHGTFKLPGSSLPPGTRTICAYAKNLGSYGSSRNVQCLTHSFNWNPSAGVDNVVQKVPGAKITGWATDPDTSSAITAYVLADGAKVATLTANGAGGSHPGHMVSTTVSLGDGKHSICIVGVNVKYGSGNTKSGCTTVTLNFAPYGALESLKRVTGSNDVVATGWAIDPNTSSPITVQARVDGGAPVTATANATRSDIASKYPGTGTAHGYAVTLKPDEFEHSICVTGINTPGTASPNTQLGCKIINAVHPTAPDAPTSVTAVAGYGGAQLSWTAPAHDGGAPWSGYTIQANNGGPKVTVAADALSATVLGLKPSTTYTFSIVATNVAGSSGAATTPAVTTQNEPPAQTSPAPISTSRYIRNVRGSAASDVATMRAEGAADAAANPSGHGYLIVLDLGGQDESRGGLILSATTRFVTYAAMVADLKSYVDGYTSKQKPSAPVTIAVATNNDVDVSRGSGANFANKVVDPVAAYAARYPGVTIAGSDDMEPGFRAGYAASKAWLQGYLSATGAPFVFTGSADGCSWTATNRGCNNGWSMSGLYYLAAGASPLHTINVPQVYNTTMAQQWRYISLTGVQQGQPKINFGGALTEWTACQQARSCGSLTGTSAWQAMWSQLRAEPSLKPSSLPYSTDLRIDS